MPSVAPRRPAWGSPLASPVAAGSSLPAALLHAPPVHREPGLESDAVIHRHPPRLCSHHSVIRLSMLLRSTTAPSARRLRFRSPIAVRLTHPGAPRQSSAPHLGTRPPFALLLLVPIEIIRSTLVSSFGPSVRRCLLCPLLTSASPFAPPLDGVSSRQRMRSPRVLRTTSSRLYPSHLRPRLPDRYRALRFLPSHPA